MDIGPLEPVRPVSMVRPSPPGADRDLTGIFAIEFRNQQRDDSDSFQRNASRGLEDEEPEEEPADGTAADALEEPRSRKSRLSSFA